jgi:hypothetical protein
MPRLVAAGPNFSRRRCESGAAQIKGATKNTKSTNAPSTLRHPPLERSVMRGTHARRMDQVFMGGPNKSGHDG